MKYGYEKPSMNVISVTVCDVIVTSGMNEAKDPLGPNFGGGTGWDDQS